MERLQYIQLFIHLYMAKKKLYSFKFKPDLVEHVRNQANKRDITLTEYFEKALTKVSKYKGKELI